jgi:hypothetical protein
MTTVTIDSPFPRRFLAWMDERFPFSHAILFFSLYATALLVGRASVYGAGVPLGWTDFAAFLPVWGFFLMLRVFDEHKDYEQDCQNYPERVLQSGLITLTHLKVAGGLAIAAQLFGSLLLDGGIGPITVWWLLVFGYSLLMAKEFFIGDWLSQRLVPYALSHMVIMPLAILWMAQMGARSEPLPLEAGYLAALAFLSGAAFEVTRKLRSPEEEREEVDSYTKSLGRTGAPLTVIALLTASTIVLVLLLRWVFFAIPSLPWLLSLAVILALPVYALLKFRSRPSPKSRKLAEGFVSLAMLGGYIVTIVAILMDRGLVW